MVLSIGLGFEAIFLFAWTSALLAIALIDLEYLIVPDVLIGVLVILGIAIRALEFLSGQSDFAVVAGEMASGLLVGGGGLYAIRAIGSRIAGREAMGLGDVKLMAAFGIVISPLGLLVLLFVACLIGLSIEMVRRLMTVAGQVQGREIAFAPSLCLAAVIVMVWQDRLVEAAFFGFSAS
ncbi:MAG: prepilin peptidase [Magnetovibrionaceae bacterium]